MGVYLGLICWSAALIIELGRRRLPRIQERYPHLFIPGGWFLAVQALVFFVLGASLIAWGVRGGG